MGWESGLSWQLVGSPTAETLYVWELPGYWFRSEDCFQVPVQVPVPGPRGSSVPAAALLLLLLSCPRVSSTNDNISGLTSPPTSIFNSTLHIQNATSRSTPALLRPLAEEDQSDNQCLRPPPSRPTVVVCLDDWLRTAA